MKKKKADYIEYEDGTRVLLDEDDVPELTGARFQNAKPFKEVFPEQHAEWKRGRGRPRVASPKVNATVRYDADVLEAFKARGKGWQTLMNQAAREWLEKHP